MRPAPPLRSPRFLALRVLSSLALAAVPLAPLAACATQRLPPPTRADVVPSVSASAAASVVDTRGPKSEHGDALGRLVDAPIGIRVDRKHVVTLPMPDGDAWTHVKFWTVTTLAGYRYGDDHHAALAVFTFAPTHGADGRDVDTCATRFAAWGERRGRKFDLRPGEARVDSIEWLGAGVRQTARVFVLDAARRTLWGTRRYATAYAAYPAWKESCLVVGVAVPAQDDDGHSSVVRDRFVRETLPKITVAPGGGVAALEYAESIGDP